MRPVMIVAGTRPEVIKLAPVIEWLERFRVDYLFVWSGQHYDYELSRVFFEEFRLPDPDEDLHTGSGTHTEQTTKIMLGLEKLIRKHSPAVVVAEGDTNTVIAASLTSLKCLIPFAHVEAGLRSWNMSMPEEVNRKVADAIATIHFAPTKLAMINLLFEGVSPNGIYLTGNTIVDVIYKHENLMRKRGEVLLSELGLNKSSFILATVHRAENTDNPRRLRSIMKALKRLSQRYDVVLPIHPRTKRRVTELGLMKCLQDVKTTEPLGYFEFLGLLENCSTVITDSGGVQEEAFTLKIPMVTIRYNTERPETTLYGLNKLAGAETELIVKLVLQQMDYTRKARILNFENPLGDGHASGRIARLLKEAAENEVKIEEPDLRNTPIVTYALLNSKPKAGNTIEPIIGFMKSGEPDPLMRGYWKLLVRIRKKIDGTHQSRTKHDIFDRISA
jgi:UDP-N-acetylglucosamine 2-epimerase (non-hydrolysing)